MNFKPILFSTEMVKAILSNRKTMNKFLSIENDGIITSETITDVNGEQIQRTGAKISGVKVCCFKVSPDFMQHSKIKFLNRTICIQNVNNAIIAKTTYAKNGNKHEADLQQVNNILNDNF